MEQTSKIYDNIQTFLYILAASCILITGIWIGFKINSYSSNTTNTSNTNEDTQRKTRVLPITPIPAPSGPEPQPYPPVQPQSSPSSQPLVKFNPTLELISAIYNPPSKEINISYKVDADTPIPPTRSYSVNFFIELNGKSLTNISENHPLHTEDMGFVKKIVLPTDSLGLKVKSSQMKISAQIHYYASDTTSGVSGTPKLIQVS